MIYFLGHMLTASECHVPFSPTAIFLSSLPRQFLEHSSWSIYVINVCWMNEQMNK